MRPWPGLSRAPGLPQASRAKRLLRLAALVAAAASLSACASMSERLADRMSEMPGIGLSADAPERPADPPAYPAVHDMPPPRAAELLNDLELRKIERDLIDARERQQTSAGIAPAARRRPEPARPRAVPVASSSQSIY